jgi:hypothetical protein
VTQPASFLGRRWRHSARHGRALHRARKLYELLITLDNAEAFCVHRVLVEISDAWDFRLRGKIIVSEPPLRIVVYSDPI